MQKSTESRILDLFFPRSCLYCKKLLPSHISDTYLCTGCKSLIPYNTVSRCAFCPNPVALWKTCNKCKKEHSVDNLLVASDYGDPVIERMVKALKYRFVRIVAHDIGDVMATYLEQRASILGLKHDELLITSIPLHPRRMRWRGFNQAELIANSLAATLGIPIIHNLLKRSNYKQPQADIEDRDERIKNAEGIFDLAVKPLNSESAVSPLAHKTILLVDDVATTGSTLDNAARVLKGAGLPAGQAGVKKVIGFVFARG